jgi:hypothetical protein
VPAGDAARELNKRRNEWLNPSDMVHIEPEVIITFPPRYVPVDEKAAAELKKRTLTNLYNAPPAWLLTAHKKLDEAAGSACGCPLEVSDAEILEFLLRENLARKPLSTPLEDQMDEEEFDDQF